MARSLGTLTIDLVAKTGSFIQGMDKAEARGKKWRRQVEQDMKKIGNAVKIASAAAVAGLGAMVVQTVNSAREIQNLSRIANATPQDFQRMTYAASRFGIEQGKVSDVLKDVNDRIGDFVQTGGGPMLDFFENIAPLVGVTADDFARLSGPEALQLYVSSLEKANVSQADFTFYMETIASDATALLPLLRDNGREMERLGDEAERTGNVFSDLEFDQLEDVRRSFDELTGAATGIKNEIVLGALPAVQDLIEFLSRESTLESAQALGGAVVTAMNKAVQAIDGTIQITQFLAEELAAMTAGAAADDIVRLEDELETLQGMLENPTTRLRFFGKDGVVAFYDEQEIQQMIAETRAKIASAQEQLQNEARNRPSVDLVSDPEAPDVSGVGGGITRTGQAARDAAEGVKELEEALAEMRAELDPTMAEFDRYADQVELIEEFNISAAEKEKLREEAFAAHQENMAELARGGREEIAEVDQGYWDRWLESAEENLMNFGDLSRSVIENFSTGFGNAIESLVFDAEDLDDALKGVAETILRGVVNSLAQMAAQWLALQAVQAALGTAATAATVGQAATASAAWAPAAAMASLATSGGNAIPAATALTTTTALAQGLALTGMAHDGIDSVPEEGTWLLNKGERVTTSGTSAKLDATLDRVNETMNNTTNNSTEVTQVFQLSDNSRREAKQAIMESAPFIREVAKQAVIEASTQGGAMSRAMGRRS